METSKTTIILAIIAMVGGWGTAIITNFDKISGNDTQATNNQAATNSGRNIENNKDILDKKFKEREEIVADSKRINEIIKLFPEDVRAASLDETARQNNNKLISLSNQLKAVQSELSSIKNKLQKTETDNVRLKSEVVSLREKAEKLDVLKSKLLFRLLEFHNHATCYGDTLNFTRGKNRDNCLTKENLASKFIEFLIELELIKETENRTREAAKQFLIKLQQENKFKKVGWYSADVFKVLVKESQNKT